MSSKSVSISLLNNLSKEGENKAYSPLDAFEETERQENEEELSKDSSHKELAIKKQPLKNENQDISSNDEVSVYKEIPFSSEDEEVSVYTSGPLDEDISIHKEFSHHENIDATLRKEYHKNDPISEDEKPTVHQELKSTQLVTQNHLHLVKSPSQDHPDKKEKAGHTKTVLADHIKNVDEAKAKTNLLPELDTFEEAKQSSTQLKPIPENQNDPEPTHQDLQDVPFTELSLSKPIEQHPESESIEQHSESESIERPLESESLESSIKEPEVIESYPESSLSEESSFHPEEKSIHHSLSGDIPTSSAEKLSLSARDVLKRADQLKIAQDRIEDLESTVFSVRQDNEQLLSEIETLKQRIEELSSSLDNNERRNRTKIESLSDERSLLEEALSQKNREHNNLKLKIEELERRLAKDLKSVRVREKELENRLELLKQEKATLLKSKDESILNLKRKITHLTIDIDGYRKKNQATQIQISENEERTQRSVRALRLALAILEGSDSSFTAPKKG